MKIGILTFHRAHNYGAVLQCYALQEVLKGMGHDVEVIDYRQKKVEDICQIWRIKHIKSIMFNLSELSKYISDYKIRKTKRNVFSIFRNTYLRVSSPCSLNNIPVDYDIYVIGSDQLWSLTCVGYNCEAGFEDMVFMGEFEHLPNSKIVGYAISSNIQSINVLSKDKLRQYVSNFYALSFREEIIKRKVVESTGKTCYSCIDPTLLLPITAWEKLITNRNKLIKEDYLLFYEARKSKGDTLRNRCIEYCLLHNLKFVDMSQMTFNVLDFVSAFKYATCIVTSSFHATVFSLIFEKPFITAILNDGHDGRIIDLLRKIEAEDALFDIKKERLVIPDLSYNRIRNNIVKLRKPSLNFIKRNI